MIETILNGKTPDIAEENITKLKAIFPDVFTEGKVDFEKLQQELGNYIETSNERYNFSWNGKSKALRLSQTPSTGTLRPCKEDSKDWDTTQNLYIEGDNLEVLKLLQKSYHSKVKMIYIDPPYNTGNDFVYPDDFSDSIEHYKQLTEQVDEEGKKLGTNTEANGRYHTEWLNMMYPRLRLARNLLSENGSIFISIDENEIDNLKKVCNEVFGEVNLVGIIANTNNPKGRSDDKYIATAHEYIVIYAKLINEISWLGFEPTEEITKRYNKQGTDGEKYREIDLRKTGENDLREDRPNLFYYFYYNENTGEFYPSKENSAPSGYIQIKPQREDGKEGNWRWGMDTTLKQISGLIPKFMPSRKVWGVMEKDYLEGRTLVKPTSSWTFKDVNSERGSEDFIRLGFDKRIFPKPKPLGTISRCIKLSTMDNDLILDFFSGSATSAHAIMQMNVEERSNRKYILVQLPEPCSEHLEAYKAGFKNICEIGKERIRRAGEKIKEEKGLEAMNLDVGFKVLKLDSSNIQKWQPDYDYLELSLTEFVNNYVDGRTELDVVYEIMIKYGLDLSYPIDEYTIDGKKVYSIGFGMLIICLDNKLTTSIAQGILDLVKDLSAESTRVVFKDNGFKTDSNKTNIKEILKCGGIEEFITL